MTPTTLRRLVRGATAVAMTGLMLTGTTGFAAASGSGHGKSDARFSAQVTAHTAPQKKDDKQGKSEDKHGRPAPLAFFAALRGDDRNDDKQGKNDDKDGRPDGAAATTTTSTSDLQDLAGGA